MCTQTKLFSLHVLHFFGSAFINDTLDLLNIYMWEDWLMDTCK